MFDRFGTNKIACNHFQSKLWPMTYEQAVPLYCFFEFQRLCVKRFKLELYVVGICNKAVNTVAQPRAKHWGRVLFRKYNRRLSKWSEHNNAGRTEIWAHLSLSLHVSTSVSSLCIFVFSEVWPGSPSIYFSSSLLTVLFLWFQYCCVGWFTVGTICFVVPLKNKHMFSLQKYRYSPFKSQCKLTATLAQAIETSVS